MRTPPNERLSSDIAEARRPRKAEPERRCVLSGETQPRANLIRLAISPSGLVLPDVQAKAPGRGAWIGATRAEMEAAQAAGKLRGGLARAYRTGDLEIPDDLAEMVERALTQTVLDRLGLEMRIGALILGSHRIAETARAGGVTLLCHASDASEDGRSKLDQAWRVGTDREGSGLRGLTLPLDRAALSVALGRENVVHLALAGDAAAERVLSPLRRLMHFIGHDVPEEYRAAPAEQGALDEDEDL